MTALTVRALRVEHRGAALVGPVSFDVARGASFGVRGPSGAGKSTLLRALVGLLPPGLVATGEVCLLGRRLGPPTWLPALRARAVLVGQTPVLFPGSIRHNVLFGVRHVERTDRAALEERARRALEEAGLWAEVADRLDAPAEDLSVGQRQRLCLGRALALRPEVLLLDEPTSALDPDARARVEAAIEAQRGDRALVLVSHDAAQLERLCDDVLELRRGARRTPEPVVSPPVPVERPARRDA